MRTVAHDLARLVRQLQAAERFEFTTVRLDRGDLQLMYGLYTVKRR